jgi:hypothetical protein
MKLDEHFWRRANTVMVMLIVGGLIMLAGVLMVGCAAGKTNSGGIVLGVDVATLPETAGEAVGFIGKFLPPPFGEIAAGAGALILGAGTAAVTARNRRKDADRNWDEATDRAKREAEERQRLADAAFDEGVARAGATVRSSDTGPRVGEAGARAG